MSHANSQTGINLSNAFAGESQAYQKYTFFANLCSQLGYKDIAKLFRETASQETQHAASHFSLLYPELVVENPETLTEDQKKALVSKCLAMAIEGETYEYTIMYPEFLEAAKLENNKESESLMQEQIDESHDHAKMFKESARRFGYLVGIENYHADQYQKYLDDLTQKHSENTLDMSKVEGKWICKKCSLIYDPKFGDEDSGVLPGTRFEDIPEDWKCPICGTEKKMFIPLKEAIENQLKK
jgi:rubrerythrin